MEKFNIKHFLILIIGIATMAAGVGLSKVATLGTSPISSIPNVTSLISPLSIGQAMMLFMVFLVLLEWIILGKNFGWRNVVQLIPSLLFGYLIDFFVKIFAPLENNNYLINLVLTLISVIILAIGVYLEINSDTIVMAGEGITSAIALKYRKNFGKTKVIIDSAMVIIAVIISLIGTHTIVGVREGTIISAIFTGRIVEFLELHFNSLTLWINN